MESPVTDVLGNIIEEVEVNPPSLDDIMNVEDDATTSGKDGEEISLSIIFDAFT